MQCRRTQLLNYFGQSGDTCGNCDTCLNPPESWDGTVAAQKVLSAVLRLKRERGQSFGAGHIVDILLGKSNPKVLQHKHNELKVFGVGADLRDTEWRGVIRQLLAQGLLAVHGEYGVLTLTEASDEVLFKNRTVLMRREPERVKPPRAAKAKAASGLAAAELAPAAADLFEQLRAWRASVAKEQGVPAYVVFHDATLRDIAGRAPATLAELGGISGIGENKLAKYGEGVLEVVAGFDAGSSGDAAEAPASRPNRAERPAGQRGSSRAAASGARSRPEPSRGPVTRSRFEAAEPVAPNDSVNWDIPDADFEPPPDDFY